jgi:hypothetical protein
MGKSHRDNHAARMKRGPVAFAKKAKRRAIDTNRRKCMVCGQTSRVSAWDKNTGICPSCNYH